MTFLFSPNCLVFSYLNTVSSVPSAWPFGSIIFLDLHIILSKFNKFFWSYFVATSLFQKYSWKYVRLKCQSRNLKILIIWLKVKGFIFINLNYYNFYLFTWINNLFRKEVSQLKKKKEKMFQGNNKMFPLYN